MHGGGVFPWRSGNRFDLLVDGVVFFPRMLAAIAAAERQIDLELYLLEEGQCSALLIDALADAARRGLRVRCLFDDFGSLGLNASSRARLTTAGAELLPYNPLQWRQGLRNLHRDHRKLLLIDDRLGFVGGAGATDRFWAPDKDAGELWHEVMVEIRGPLIADWRSLFEHQWAYCLQHCLWGRQGSPELPHLPPNPSRGDGLGRVAYAAARQHRDILRALVRAIGRSRQRVWLATPYFLPSWKVRRALRKAAHRGVEVCLLLASHNTDHPPARYAAQRYYRRLLRAGVRIFEYQPRFLHLKMVLVDDWVSVGSCNFDHWNLRWNLEANLEALDPTFTRMVTECFGRDFRQSLEIDPQAWQARPWYRRLYQHLWGWVDQLIVNLLNNRP